MALKSNDLGTFDTCWTEHWTKQSLNCYKIKCRCNKCKYKNYSKICKIKPIVLELVRKFGIPEKENQA